LFNPKSEPVVSLLVLIGAVKGIRPRNELFFSEYIAARTGLERPQLSAWSSFGRAHNEKTPFF
jgi:hypothetical protein